MDVEVVVVFHKPATVVVVAKTKNKTTGALEDPTSVVASIADNGKSLKVDEDAMTKVDTGIYSYNYNLQAGDAAGTWSYLVDAIDGSGGGATHATASGEFIVENWP